MESSRNEVEVFLPAELYINDFNWDDIIEGIAKELNGERTGAGMGWGYRDLVFEFPNRTLMEQFQGQLESLVARAKARSTSLEIITRQITTREV